MANSWIEIYNMIKMIGCDANLFLRLIEWHKNISFSGGSWYADFYIFGDGKLIAIFDWKGNLKERVQAG